MTMHREKRNRILLGAIILAFIVATAGLVYPIGQVTANQGGTTPEANPVGESSFIDVQQEFSSGNSPPEQGLWYAWVNTGNSHVVLLAASFFGGGGPSYGGYDLPSPVSVIVGQHFNTSSGEVFVANTPTFMEIYNDSNHNSVPDSDFSHGTSEIIYYIIWNASQSFSSTSVEKQIVGGNVAHYRWSVRYNGVMGLLQHPFFEHEEQYPIISCWIDYVQCSYDYYLEGNSSYLKVGFEASPLTDLLTIKLVNGTYQLVPASLSLDGMSLAVLFSTSIACADPSYQIIVQGQAYNSTTTQIPVIPTDNATINIGNGAVYNFIYNQNYTLIKDGTSHTYASQGSACGDISVLSPYILTTGGPCLFIRWNETTKVLVDLIPRISNSLQVETILRQNSSFFYRVSFPTWGNGTLIHDPTYIGQLSAFPHNPITPSWLGGTEILPIIVVSFTAGLGVVMLLASIVERRRTTSLTPGRHNPV